MNARSLPPFLFLILICVCCFDDAMAQVRLSSEDAEKLLLKAPEAEYPRLGHPLRLKGVVTVEATISEAGIVISARAVSGHPLLNASAVTAVRKYKYNPHTVDGKAVPFTTEIYVGFPPSLLTKERREALLREEDLAKQYFQLEPECAKFSHQNINWQEIEEACRNLTRIADQLPSTRALEKMRAHELLGVMLASQKRYPEALNSFNRAFIPVESVLTERNVELGRLHAHIAMTHDLMGDLEKARASYVRAEKIYQAAYKETAKGQQSEFSEELKKSYAQQLRTLLGYHLKVAEKAGATAEIEEIKRLMKIYEQK